MSYRKQCHLKTSTNPDQTKKDTFEINKTIRLTKHDVRNPNPTCKQYYLMSSNKWLSLRVSGESRNTPHVLSSSSSSSEYEKSGRQVSMAQNNMDESVSGQDEENPSLRLAIHLARLRFPKLIPQEKVLFSPI